MKNVAFIFPGQGSQARDMGKDFYDHSQRARDMLADAGDRIDVNFERLIFHDNADLNLSANTQPVVLTTSIIALEHFREKADVKPVLAFGHSLGEYSALVSVGALDFLDAVQLTHLRGALMQDACRGKDAGMMALIGIDDETAESICREQRNVNGRQIWAANYNGDGQIVLAGVKKDLEETVVEFKSNGARMAKPLGMSVASHCPMLDTLGDNFRKILDQYMGGAFDAPVVSNMTAKKYDTPAQALEMLTGQLTSPVLYKQSLRAVDAEVDAYLEFGHGGVLKGLNKRLTDKPTYVISDFASLEAAIAALS